MHKAGRHAPMSASALAKSREPWRQQFGAKRSTRHDNADTEEVFVLSFPVRGKVKINFKHVILNGYGWNLLGYISIYKRSFFFYIVTSALKFRVRTALNTLIKNHFIFREIAQQYRSDTRQEYNCEFYLEPLMCLYLIMCYVYFL